MADKVPGIFSVEADLQYFTPCLTQFGASTGQRPSPVSNVNAATLFILSEGSNFSCMEEICAILAGLFYFTVWVQFFALTDYVIMTSNNHQFLLSYLFLLAYQFIKSQRNTTMSTCAHETHP